MNRKIVFILVSLQLITTSFADGQVWTDGFSYNHNLEYGNQSMAVTPHGELMLFTEFQGIIEIQGMKYKSQGERDFLLLHLDTNLKIMNHLVFGSDHLDRVGGIALDSNGDIVICGYYTDSLRIANYNTVSFGKTDFFVARLSAKFEPVWMQSMGSEDNDAFELSIGAIAIDSKGDVICSGAFSEEWRTTPFLIEDTVVNSYGKSDVFVTKLSKLDGKLIWVKVLGGKGHDYTPNNLEIDKENNIYAIINPADRVYFDSVKHDNPYIGAQSILFKIDGKSGGKIWHFGVYNIEFGTNYTSSVACDNNLNSYIVGSYYTEKIDIGGEIIYDRFHLMGQDAFVAKVDSLGKLVWASKIQGATTDGAYDVCVSNKNHAIISGYYTEQCFYQTDSVGYIGQSGTSGFVLEIDSNGAPLYFGSIGNNGSSSVNHVASFGSDRVIISGSSGPGKCTFDGTLEFVSQEPFNFIATGNIDSAVLSNTSILQRSLRLYPNPSSNISYCDNPFSQGVTNLTIVDAVGKIMISKEVSTRSIPIPVKQWTSGLYEIILTSSHSNQTYHAKLFKK